MGGRARTRVMVFGAMAASATLGAVVTGGVAWAPPADPGTILVREQNLDGNGLVRVHEQGTAQVSVVNSPEVRIAATNPYQRTVSASNKTSQVENLQVPVPAGKRLVIQYVSVFAEVPLGQTASAAVTGQGLASPAQSSTVRLAMPRSSTFGDRAFLIGSQEVVLNAGPGSGSTLFAAIARSAEEGTWDAQLTVSGYLVDLPA
jgi:hypothetical protein